jgi:hypothetical protein
MELYQWVAIGTLLAMALMVHSVVQLNACRRRLQITKQMFNHRDLSVLRKPANFEYDEVILVRIHWVMCVASLLMLLWLAYVVPPEVLAQLAEPPIEPASTTAPATQ